MWYFRKLPDGLVVLQTRAEHAPQLEELQRICFPTLDAAERFTAAHYLKHIELFPDGQFVVLDDEAGRSSKRSSPKPARDGCLPRGPVIFGPKPRSPHPIKSTCSPHRR